MAAWPPGGGDQFRDALRGANISQSRFATTKFAPPLNVYDAKTFPGCRSAWHLARCTAVAWEDKIGKMIEIRHSVDRLWVHDPAAYRALGFR